MAYALVKWLVLRASPYFLIGGGLWVIIKIDTLNGAILLLGAGIMLLASSLTSKRELATWNYQAGGKRNPAENPDKDAGQS